MRTFSFTHTRTHANKVDGMEGGESAIRSSVGLRAVARSYRPSLPCAVTPRPESMPTARPAPVEVRSPPAADPMVPPEAEVQLQLLGALKGVQVGLPEVLKQALGRALVQVRGQG